MTAAARPMRARVDPALGLSRSFVALLFATAVVTALGLSVLRNQILELRYRAAEVLREERALEEERRALAVRVRKLRDPKRLARLARERGFVRPERVVNAR